MNLHKRKLLEGIFILVTLISYILIATGTIYNKINYCYIGFICYTIVFLTEVIVKNKLKERTLQRVLREEVLFIVIAFICSLYVFIFIGMVIALLDFLLISKNKKY